MKEIQLNINGKKLFERMKAESGKMAQAKLYAGQTEKLSAHTIITDDEKGYVYDYFPIAVNECATIINHYLGECRSSRDADPENTGYHIYVLSIDIPANWPEDARTPLEEIVANIVCNRCLQQWYMLVRADDANSCAAKIQLYMKQLQDMLSLRKRP